MERMMEVKEFEELVKDRVFLDEVANWANEHRKIIDTEFENGFKEFSSRNIPDETIYSIATLSLYGEAKGIDFLKVILAICLQEMEAA